MAQVVKRCPIDLRHLLQVPSGLSSVTLANVVAAHALGGFLDDELHRARLAAATERLKALRLDTYEEPSWGYHWDAQSRVFFYPRSEPNGIATAFAGHALLDACERLEDSDSMALGVGAARSHKSVEFPAQREPGEDCFGYLAGDRTPIHNANLLACSLLARVASVADRPELRSLAERGVAYTLAHQRPDGGWRYGQTASTTWVDGFHTGYVLDALAICRDHGVGGDIDGALRRGLDFYSRRLFLPDGTPKYYEDAVQPIDAQNVAQGIQTFSMAAAQDPSQLDQAVRIFGYAMRRMWRGDGVFLFQRRRLWINPTPHMRWVQSPMLRALAHLSAALGVDG